MSKGLKAWKRICVDFDDFDYYDCRDGESFNASLIVEEVLKAFEIIKNKRVDMWHVTDLLEQDYEMYLAWCIGERYSDEFILTKEEFDLLKEVLEDSDDADSEEAD